MQRLSTIVGYSGKQVVLLKKLYGFKIGEDNCCCGFLIAIVPRDINTLKTKEKKKVQWLGLASYTSFGNDVTIKK